MKTCSKCGALKPLAAFDLSSKYRSGRRSECKECRKMYYYATLEMTRAKGKAWRAANPEVAARNHARWAKANADRLAEYQLQYRLRSENKLRKSQLAQQAAAVRSEAQARRNARKRQATPAWADRGAILAYYETAEALRMWTGEWYEVDHIVPLQSRTVQGLHCEANLQILTEAENVRKGNRHWPNMWTATPGPL